MRAFGVCCERPIEEGPMDYPRYKPVRSRPPGQGAFADYATAVLSGSVVAPKRTRPYRVARKPVAPLVAAKTEG
jgi:hypothetical protein